MILGSWDGVLHRAPYSAGSLLLPLPLWLSLLMHSLALSVSNKQIKSFKKFRTRMPLRFSWLPGRLSTRLHPPLFL